MNSALKWKLIAGFVLVFIAGGMTGAYLDVCRMHYSFMHSPDHGMLAQRMRDRLQTQLNLTSEQSAKVSPIMDKAAAQLDQIRTETGRRVHETMTQAHNDMSATLTEEQRTKLEKIEAQHRHRMHGFRDRRQRPPPTPTR